MKVLLVHNSYRQRGGEDSVFEQERSMLERAGHQLLIYRHSNSEIDSFSPLARLLLPINTVWSSGARSELAAMLDTHSPDLVHVHNTFVLISPSIYSVCREKKVPVVQTLHNFRWLCPSAIFYRDGKVCEDCVTGGLVNSVRHACYRGSKPATAAIALALATHRHLGTFHDSIGTYITPSAFARDKFIASGFPAEKIVVKPNFVDPDPGPRDGVGAYALFAGRLSAEKGLYVLLRAWEMLSAHVPLQIIGDGPERHALEAFVRRRNIPNVTFRGALSRHDTFTAMKGARFVVVPSTVYETFGLVIAEAMACGAPVLCSRLGAMQELVADHDTGLHFTAGDAHDLATKAAWAWNHPPEISVMGRTARREFEKRYTSRRNYAQLMEIYDRALGRNLHAAAALAS